jgi:hypothetical protein
MAARRTGSQVATARIVADEIRDCDLAVGYSNKVYDQMIALAEEGKRRNAKYQDSKAKRMENDRRKS